MAHSPYIQKDNENVPTKRLYDEYKKACKKAIGHIKSYLDGNVVVDNNTIDEFILNIIKINSVFEETMRRTLNKKDSSNYTLLLKQFCQKYKINIEPIIVFKMLRNKTGHAVLPRVVIKKFINENKNSALKTMIADFDEVSKKILDALLDYSIDEQISCLDKASQIKNSSVPYNPYKMKI